MAESAKDPIFIGVAWPYANGGLHLGHVAGSLLPPDIFRRYKRMAGHDVLMVSGSDCHGTPILLKAEAEGTTPQEIVDRFHGDHTRALERLSISFDLFTKTTTDNHRKWVQKIFLAAKAQRFIETRVQPAPFDPKADRFLPDRYVEGICPHCDYADARGDQCDNCGKTLDPQDLKSPRSKLNPEAAVEFRDTEHFFFLLSKLQPMLESYVAATADHWRPNTINFTQNWLQEGLQDRAITRDLTWGVPIPLDGFDDKRIYVWFEAVCGYLSAAVEWASQQDGRNWEHWWTNPATKSYYFLGKDNIPFHSIIWPAILTAYNQQRRADGDAELVLPYDVPANEFLNLSGEQFSKSRGVGIGVHDVLDRFQADAVRYYLAINMPEQRDSDWTWDDFLAKVNDELVGIVGNLVHRVLSFTSKNLGTVPPAPPTGDALDANVLGAIEACAESMAQHLDRVELKKALRRLVEFAGVGNQTMQEVAPWKLLKEDPETAARALHSLLRIVKALAVFLAPYTPEAASKIWTMVGESGSVHDAAWSDASAPLAVGATLQAEALFTKLDPADIPKADPDKNPPPEEPPMDTVTFDEFTRIQFRLATIKSVQEHPDADKLYVLHLDVGELGQRQVVAGLKEAYTPGELEGQTVAFVANLKPAKLRGVESQGMILAADHEGTVAVLNPNRDLPAGATIR